MSCYALKDYTTEETSLIAFHQANRCVFKMSFYFLISRTLFSRDTTKALAVGSCCDR